MTNNKTPADIAARELELHCIAVAVEVQYLGGFNVKAQARKNKLNKMAARLQKWAREMDK